VRLFLENIPLKLVSLGLGTGEMLQHPVADIDQIAGPGPEILVIRGGIVGDLCIQRLTPGIRVDNPGAEPMAARQFPGQLGLLHPERSGEPAEGQEQLREDKSRHGDHHESQRQGARSLVIRKN